MASPVGDSYAAPTGGVIAAGRRWLPDWAPSAGELKTISKPAGYYGTNAGATLAEIDPIYQTWHPAYGVGNSYSQPFATGSAAWNSSNAYCGMCFNRDTRQYIGYGAGHSAVNVCAPYAFDLNDLKWKWLDAPLPFDSFYGHGFGWPLNESEVMAYYTNGELNSWEWGELNGSSSTWGTKARPGIIQPITGHSRALNLCIPANKCGNAKGKFFKFDAPSGNSGGITGAFNSHLFDLDSAIWARTTNYASVGSGGGMGTGYAEAINKVIAFGNGGSFSSAFLVFDVATETWTTRTSSNSVQTGTDYGGNVVHDAGGLYIIPAPRAVSNTPANSPGTGVTFVFFAAALSDLNAASGAFSISTLTVSVATTWPRYASGFNDYLGWAYCPDDKCLYCIAPESGSNKYWRLSPPVGAVTPAEHLAGTWALTEHTFSSGSFVETIAYLNQYNRTQWDYRSRSFIWQSGGINDPVMSWRPHGV